jgi:hypothetical protein
VFGAFAVRIVVSIIAAALSLTCAPARAADLGGNGAGGWVAVHSAPFVTYDFEPGIVARAYWLEPWAGRHYFPSGGKLPVLGRREEIKPASATSKRNFYREWSSFPVDTIKQPPLILNQQQQYFPQAAPAPATPELSK